MSLLRARTPAHQSTVRGIPLIIVTVPLMWSVASQGYKAILLSPYTEQFAARIRVSAVAVGTAIGLVVGAFISTLFVVVAPAGTKNIPIIIGSIAFGVATIAAIAASTFRETSRIRMEDLGDPEAVPIPKDEYLRMRAGNRVVDALRSRERGLAN